MGQGGQATLFLTMLDWAMHEAALFAAMAFLVLGASDMMVDLLWIGRVAARYVLRRPCLAVATLPPVQKPGILAVFIPAWDESAVIGAMLRNTLAAFGEGPYRLYVGCYPNDPATIAAVSDVGDARVRLVIGDTPGPTTKAHCLNLLWRTLLADELADGTEAKAVILHDAEDVVHPDGIRLFDALTERYDLVQIPVFAIPDPASRWIGGHYIDEFAESHAKELVVREMLGAGIPSAGVGCAFARHALAAIAARQGGKPFDADSLTEDYELGLKLRAMGGSQAFVRVMGSAGDGPVATRELFPATIAAAVGQKSRWIAGIALSGWDRLGWGGGVAERWMRLRDRQSVVAAAALLSGYGSFILWAWLQPPGWLGVWQQRPISDGLAFILTLNLMMLMWRIAMRCAFVTYAYGWREGLHAIPRIAVSNVIAMLSAWRALARYRRALRGGGTVWAKTAHAFPTDIRPR